MKWIIIVWLIGVFANIVCLGIFMVCSYLALGGNKTAMRLLRMYTEFDESLMHAAVEDPETAIYSIGACVLWPIYWPISKWLDKKDKG